MGIKVTFVETLSNITEILQKDVKQHDHITSPISYNQQ